MILIQPSKNFGFVYEAFDQSASLSVQFSIYDASSGTPVLIQTLGATYEGSGNYTGTYLAQPDIQYMVTGLVYTDGTFTTIDTTRSQFSEVYQTFNGSSVLSSGFTYASVGYESNLSIQAQVYNTTTGTSVLQASVDLVYVNYGVYYGAFAGALFDNFQIISIVFTDNTYTTPNFNYAPATSSFSCIGVEPTPPPITGSSALIDVTQLLHDPDFVENMSLISRIPAVNAYGENIISETTLNSIGSVQPTSGRDLLRLPEALRQMDVFTFWFQGVIAGSSAGVYPMILVFKGKRYQVQKILDWTSWGHGWSEGIATAELPS